MRRQLVAYKFWPKLSLSGQDRKVIAQTIKLDHAFRGIYPSLQGFFASKTSSACGIRLDKELVSFAWRMPRKWRIKNLNYHGISIGLVTTIKKFRGQGYAARLMSEIEKDAKKHGVDFLYLQGIEQFYAKMGYVGFASKSKITFERKKFKGASPVVRKLQVRDTKEIKKLFQEYAQSEKGYVCRSGAVWRDLIGPLAQTFLFYNPHVICDGKKTIIGYFCSSPEDEKVIREFACKPSLEAVEKCLLAICHQKQIKKQEHFEIFAPFHGVVADFARVRTGGDFVSFMRPRSSNMIKILNPKIKLENIQKTFVFQGDNI